MLFVIGVWTFLRALLFGSAALALENLALRHQLLVLQRSGRRPRLARWDRVLWVWLRDAIYGQDFSRRVERMRTHEVLTAPRAPWQNPFVERVIGSLRRECLDHFVILSGAHLRRLLRAYVA